MKRIFFLITFPLRLGLWLWKVGDDVVYQPPADYSTFKAPIGERRWSGRSTSNFEQDRNRLEALAPLLPLALITAAVTRVLNQTRASALRDALGQLSDEDIRLEALHAHQELLTHWTYLLREACTVSGRSHLRLDANLLPREAEVGDEWNDIYHESLAELRLGAALEESDIHAATGAFVENVRAELAEKRQILLPGGLSLSLDGGEVVVGEG